MSGKCSICRHSKVEKIDKLLQSDYPLKYISKKFNISYASLWRHRKNHLPTAIHAQENEVKSLISDVSERLSANKSSKLPIQERIASSYEFIMEEAMFQYSMYSRQGEGLLAVKFLEQARRALDSASKAVDFFSKKTDDQDWDMLRKIVLEALDDFPEAKLKVAQAISENV